MKSIVIALGGNAILRKGQKPTINAQIKNIRRALRSILYLIPNNDIVIVHGSGPQTGYLLSQQKNTSLDVIDAETEGQIGYLIQQELDNLLKKSKREVVTILTRVLVDKKDKAFKNPSKFVGAFYKKKGKNMKVDSRGGYRRVVASPKPIKIIEEETIKDLLKEKTIVIAAGGGGIPVVKNKNKLEGVEAVVDKDLASSVLANSIKAQELIMITDVQGIYLNYKQKNQKRIRKIRTKELEKYYKAGQFPPGSMGPKVLAALEFLKKNRKAKRVIISDFNVKKGTEIVR